MLKYNISIQNVYTHKQMQMEFGTEKVKSAPKPCPQRLNAGFRGTVQDFKHEVERCFIYGWFFTDILSQEQINKIPDLMEIAKNNQIKKTNKLKEARKGQIIQRNSDNCR